MDFDRFHLYIACVQHFFSLRVGLFVSLLFFFFNCRLEGDLIMMLCLVKALCALICYTSICKQVFQLGSIHDVDLAKICSALLLFFPSGDKLKIVKKEK